MRRVRALAALAPRAALRMALASALAAVTEGLGVVLLVPMLAQLGGAAPALPGPLAALSDVSLPVLLAVFVGLVVIRAGAELLRAVAATDLSAAVTDRLRAISLDAVLSSPWRTLAGLDLARVRALLVTSLERTGHAALLLADAARTAAGLAALAAAGLVIAPVPTLVAMAAGLLLFVAYRTLRRQAHALGSAISRGAAALQRQMDETFAALRLIKSYGREDRALADTQRALADLRQAQRSYVLATAGARGLVQVVAAAALGMGLWAAVTLWNWSLALILPLAALAVRAVPLLAALQQAVQDWHHAAPAFDEVEALTAAARGTREAAAGAAIAPPRRAIALSGVSLRHAPGRVALDAATLELPVGTITALSGPSGAGKSTLADVLSGLVASDEGSLMLDGAALAREQLPAWRRRVAYVHQDPVLFTATVRENLLWAAPAADEGALDDALTRAGAHFVTAFPQGLDTPLGEGGRALSGGERQRIALARALLSDPALLILDEATSALDPESEAAITAAVAALAGRTTVLIIAHRGALAAIASRRYEILHGKVNGPLLPNSP